MGSQIDCWKVYGVLVCSCLLLEQPAEVKHQGSRSDQADAWSAADSARKSRGLETSEIKLSASMLREQSRSGLIARALPGRNSNDPREESALTLNNRYQRMRAWSRHVPHTNIEVGDPGLPL